MNEQDTGEDQCMDEWIQGDVVVEKLMEMKAYISSLSNKSLFSIITFRLQNKEYTIYIKDPINIFFLFIKNKH